MAMGTLSLSASAVAAAAGIYFFRHHQTVHAQTRNPDGDRVSETRAEKTTGGGDTKTQKKKVETPRFAVELDGLHYLETLVAR